MNTKKLLGGRYGKVKKAVLIIAIVTLLGAVAIPLKARAQTSYEDLQAQISSLLQQITILQTQLGVIQSGGVISDNTAKCDFDRNLSVGVSGTDVVCLQDYLTVTDHFNFSGGSTGYFGPITRTAVSAWQADNGVAPAVGYFGPISQAKYNSLVPNVIVPPVVEEPVDETVAENTAELSSDNPESSVVAKNASNFKIMEVQFNGNEDVDKLTVKRIGFNARADFGHIYLYEDGVRLTSGKLFNSNDEVVFNNLNLRAPFVLSVVADFSSDTSGNIAKVELDGDYAGLPLKSNDFTIVGINVGEIALTSVGSLDDVIVGQRNAQVSEFKIAVDDVEDVVIEHVELYNGGHDVLSDVKITDGENTWSGTVSNHRLIFDIDSTIRSGKSETYEVYADVDGRDGDTIDLYIRDSYDIRATGKQFGFGVTIDTSDFDEGSNVFNLLPSGLEDINVKAKSTDDTIAYWGQTLTDVAKFRFTADESEGFYIEELRFADTLASSTEELSITYKTKNGNTVTKTEDVEEDEDVIFDSFSSSDRPYVAKNSDMDIYVGLTLTNDEDSVRLDEDKIVKLIEYSVVGDSSDEEDNNVEVSVLMKDTISTNAATVTLSEEGRIDLESHRAIEFSLLFANDNRITSAFTSSTTTGITLKLKTRFADDDSLFEELFEDEEEGGLEVEVRVNGTKIDQIGSISEDDNLLIHEEGEFVIRLSDDEENPLEVSDEAIDIEINFVGDTIKEFNYDEGDRLSIEIEDINWTDNYDEDTEDADANANEAVNAIDLEYLKFNLED
ncbi:MAG: peptidoglycan-binding protein, partial [Patescibacteria group bacterium]|nr:peptidoglycan-binding protein [Patescibacteria group bacterium]